MKLTIKNIPSEIFINTILIYHNKLNPTNVYLLRCYRCGSAINQVQGIIGAVSAGLSPTNDVVTITQCQHCKENYTFQSGYGQSNTTDLTLSSLPTVSTFHCLICRIQLVQYNSKGAVLLPDFKLIALPGQFPCFNPVCNAKYFLKDIVEPVVI